MSVNRGPHSRPGGSTANRWAHWDKCMDKPSSKVLFCDGKGNNETLWAYSLGEDTYKLDNSPFFAYGISYQDEVIAKPKNIGDIPEFIKINRKSGNKTIRVSVDLESKKERVDEIIINELISLGCSVEGANKKYLSINIPNNIKLEIVVEYLEEKKQLWEYADPTYEEVNKQKK